MSKRKSQKRTTSQKVLWGLSMLIVSSMVISLILVALPQPASPTPTPWPTLTPRPPSTATPLPVLEPTEPEDGPLPATGTPAITPPVSETPTLTPTTVLTIAPPTVTPSSADVSFKFDFADDSHSNPKAYAKVLEAVPSDSSEFLSYSWDLVNKVPSSLWAQFEETMVGFVLPFYCIPASSTMVASRPRSWPGLATT